MADLKYLHEIADCRETISYTRQFTESELTEIKESFAQNSLKFVDIENQMKEATKDFKDQLKPISKQLEQYLTWLKDKSESMTESCYVEFDHSENRAKFYSPTTGDMVYSRPLMANEKQGKLTLISKTGTND